MGAARPGRARGIRVREVTRARLLATAEEMFLAGGYTATSVDAIAHRAGYTTGAVYSNFGGKGDLFLAVIERATDVDLAALRAGLDDATTDEQRLSAVTTTIARDPARWRARVAATLEFLSDARRHPELLDRLRAAQRRADEATGELLAAQCRALGLAPPVPVEELTLRVMAVVNGLALRSLFDDGLDVARAATAAINSLLGGAPADELPARAAVDST